MKTGAMFLQRRLATSPHLFHGPAHNVAYDTQHCTRWHTMLTYDTKALFGVLSPCLNMRWRTKWKILGTTWKYSPFQHWTNFVKLDRANLALLRRVLERPSPHLPRLLPRYQKCLHISVFWSVTKVLIVFVDSCTKVDFIFLVRAVSLLMVLLR